MGIVCYFLGTILLVLVGLIAVLVMGSDAPNLLIVLCASFMIAGGCILELVGYRLYKRSSIDCES